MLLENRKNNLKLSLLKQPRHEIGPARSARATLGPSAQQPMARPPNRPGAAPLLGPNWPVRRPPFPAVRRRRSRSDGRALFSREQNSATPRRPQTLGSFSLSVFSLHETEATAAGHGGPAEWAGRRHRGLLAGARARRWVSAPPSSSPWMAPRFRARARAPRRPGGERRSILCRAPTKRAARVCSARGRPAVGRCR